MISNNQLATNMEEIGNLLLLQSILTNLGTNISLINEGNQGQTITVNNANLYQLAAQYYSDATQWTTIAEANGLDDPLVTGGALIRIDVTNGGSGYSATPTITIVGDLINADNANAGSATATVISGVITQIQIQKPGNYMSLPTIVITDISGSGAIAIATCAMQLIIPNKSISTDGIFTT